MTTPLDWDKALENADGSEDLLGELVEIYLDTRADMLRQVREAIDQRDGPALRRTAHSLKGSLRILAAREATEAALRLETMGAAGDFAGVDEAWTTLEQKVAQVTAALVARTGGAS